MPFIPESIEELCEKAALKQRDIARLLDVSTPTVCLWKKGTRSITIEHVDALYKLAKKYGVKVEFYISG